MILLEEKDFIHEEYCKNPLSFWKWLATVLIFTFVFSGATVFYYSVLARQYSENPFLQVTNREMSVFLWQNPQYMRVHAKSKNGYLPAFEYAERIGLNPEYADDFVIAPPDLLFLYHNWNRLIGDAYIPRAISGKEFSTFLSAVPEWTPRYWQKAPENYLELVELLPNHLSDDLNLQDFDALPLKVRQAFVGWKNYFFEGYQINKSRYAYNDAAKLLSFFPNYGRAFWRNILGSSYLSSFHDGISGVIPPEELSPLLRAALFNLEVGSK